MTKARVLLVEARFYEDISDALAAGAIAVLEQAGAQYDRLAVPGALEIPGAIRMALGRYDAFVALGCVIRGETTHYDIVSNARGLMQLTLDHAVPIGNGIITVEDEDQAWARAKADDLDKGGGAARAALRMLEIKRGFEAARS
jgi:6,7-dimethyl-8-ribityllumazine synthase